MTPNGPQPTPSYPRPPYPGYPGYPGARPPRPPHVPRRFSWGGKVLAIIVAVYLISLWFAFLGVAAAVAVVAYGSFLLLIMEPKGTFSFGGRIHWSTLSGLGKFSLVFAFICLPEFMLPICLWFAVRDHLRATNASLRGKAKGYWQRVVAASRRTQVGLGVAALVTVIAFCSLSGVASASSLWKTSADSTANSADVQNQVAGSTGGSSSSNDGQLTQAAMATATTAPTATPQPTNTPLPPPTATPVPPAPTNIFLTITCASATDYSSGQVCVHTDPGAALTITVNYCSGYSATSRSLQGTEYANSAGNYTWTWTPETKCRGQADAYVVADWNGQEVTADRAFTVN